MTSAHQRVLKQSLRVGIAAAVATTCSQLLNLPNPWFATLAAIVAMHSTLQASRRSAVKSLAGAFIGAGVGLFFAYFFKDQAWAVGTVVGLSLLAFGWIRQRTVGEQAALIASVIVLVPEHADFSTVDFARIRLEQAVIGIAVAMLVQALVFPPRAHRQVRRELRRVYRDMAQLISYVTDVIDGSDYPAEAIRSSRVEVRSRLADIDSAWDDAMGEHPSHGLLGAHWRVTTRRIWEQCAVLTTEVREATASPLLVRCRGDLVALAELIRSSMAEVSAWFGGEPDALLVLPDFEPHLAALLEHVREEEEAIDIDRTHSYANTLQALAVANAFVVITDRLVDQATQHAETVRIHDPMS